MRQSKAMKAYLWGKRVKTRYLQLNNRTEKVIRVRQIVCHDLGKDQASVPAGEIRT